MSDEIVEAPIIKEQKLSNYNKELPKKLSNLNFNEDEKNKEIENCSLITNKIDDIFFNYNEKREEEIMDDLRQLVQLIIENKEYIKLKYSQSLVYDKKIIKELKK